MNCEICREKCDGNIRVMDADIGRELVVCGDCLNDFGNQDYDRLTRKLEGEKEEYENYMEV